MNNLNNFKTHHLLSYKAPGNLPKELVYPRYDVPVYGLESKKRYKLNIYRMFDIEKDKCIGEMYGRVFKNADCTEIYPEMFKCDVFEINYLNIAPPERRKGYGNKFIKFAQAESRKNNCEGRVFTCASTIYDNEHPSHIFYRKQGFTSVKSNINRAIDKAIETGQELNAKYTEDLLMYLPVKKKQFRLNMPKLPQVIKKLFKHFI